MFDRPDPPGPTALHVVLLWRDGGAAWGCEVSAKAKTCAPSIQSKIKPAGCISSAPDSHRDARCNRRMCTIKCLETLPLHTSAFVRERRRNCHSCPPAGRNTATLCPDPAQRGSNHS